jgi:hypothetical protein
LGPIKKEKIQKRQKKYIQKKTQKIIAVKKGCQSAQKSAKNWLRKFKSKKN